MTNQETIIMALIDRGCKEVQSTSRKYRQFIAPNGKNYWVGKQGAVRIGKCISKSTSITAFINLKKLKAQYA